MTQDERNAKRVKKYIDSLVDVAIKARKLSLDGCPLIEKGVPKDERRQVSSVSLFCGGIENNLEVHIYSGLQEMARLLDLPVTEDFDTYDSVLLSCMYRGCKLFQLGYDEEKGVR